MVIGEIIEWVYKYTGDVVVINEHIWSTTMKQRVPIGSGLTHVLISIDNERICWLNAKGCFHARVDDTVADRAPVKWRKVFPHARE